mgnify:CR=1 FL=1
MTRQYMSGWFGPSVVVEPPVRGCNSPCACTGDCGVKAAVCNHDDIEPTSQCCGAPAYYGFCGRCRNHTGWVKYCAVCDTEVPAEVNEARP